MFENIIVLMILFSACVFILACIQPNKLRASSRGGITLSTVLAYTKGTMNIQDVIASADGDTTATLPHLLVNVPLFVSLTQMLSQALTALSAWAATTVDGTNVVCTKLTSTGSGNAGVQLRVVAWAPHTSVR